jgi:DNA-binding MarR family transcriptional regulator
METEDLRTYRLLEEIDNSHAPSQRELAQKLNISLGLVNAFIKRLTRKGYFKITTIPKNRVRYILTPKGAAEKTRLTYEYIQYSFRFYRDARKKLRKLFTNLEDQAVKRIVFYGISDLAEIALIALQETDLKLVAVVDERHCGETFINFTIQSPEQLVLSTYDAVILTQIDPGKNVCSKLKSYGIPRSKMKRLY